MRKKLIGMMMAFVLLIGSVMPVSATEVRVDGQSVDVQVEHDNKSSFCINIPESIYLDDSTGYYFTASLMNITSSERVCIYANDKTILDKGIMPSEKVLDFPVDCNTLTGSVNL